jgi:hypothetical protein
MASFQLLQRGGIYRVVYSQWKTNPRPIIFVLHASPFKVHALSINAPGIGPADAVIFAQFINKMKRIRGVENWSGRVLYRILKTYFPNIVRKTYRTFISSYIGAISLVSTGILPPELFTSYAKSAYNEMLYRDAGFNQIFRIVSQRTGGAAQKPDPKKAPFYVPPQKPQAPQENKNIQEPRTIENEVDENENNIEPMTVENNIEESENEV